MYARLWPYDNVMFCYNLFEGGKYLLYLRMTMGNAVQVKMIFLLQKRKNIFNENQALKNNSP